MNSWKRVQGKTNVMVKSVGSVNLPAIATVKALVELTGPVHLPAIAIVKLRNIKRQQKHYLAKSGLRY